MDTSPHHCVPEMAPLLSAETQTEEALIEETLSEQTMTPTKTDDSVLDLSTLDLERQDTTTAADQRSLWSRYILHFMLRGRLHYLALSCLVLSQFGIFLCQASGGDQCYVLGHIYLSVFIMLYAVALSHVERVIEPLIRPLLMDSNPYED